MSDENKYLRYICGTIVHDDGTKESATMLVDFYDIADAFLAQNEYKSGSAAVQHAVKKLLCPGMRGLKSYEQDIREAKRSLERALEQIIDQRMFELRSSFCDANGGESV